MVPEIHANAWGIVAPSSTPRSNVPSRRLASPHDASTIACPWAARAKGPPRNEGAAEKPIGRNRAFISRPATVAAPAVPPAARTDSDANCAAPAKTTIDMTTAGSAPSTGRARTPNETATAKTGRTSGSPARTPSRTEDSFASAAMHPRYMRRGSGRELLDEPERRRRRKALGTGVHFFEHDGERCDHVGIELRASVPLELG